jgi:hypothetical protein
VEDSFGFDPQLPGLSLAFDLPTVARLFEAQWPAPAARAPVQVQDCRLQDTKYQPAVRCVTTYELRVAHPGEGPWPTIGVLDISPAGPAHRLFVDDPALPALSAVTDPAYMGARFAQIAAHNGDADAVRRCTIRPIRYKPGARCVLRYEIHTAAGPRVFFGKLLAQDSDPLVAILNTLHQVSEQAAGMPRILPPVAYWPDLQMLVQPEVSGGAELNTLAFDGAVDAAVRQQWLTAAGAGLAALHDSAGAPGPQRTLADDLAELLEYRAPLAQARPALAARYATLSDAITAHAADRAVSAPVASHGAFRTDQYMIEDGRLVMIDLDSFCWAAPERDIGNFLAYLRWKAIRRPAQAALITDAERAFLAGYAAVRPLPDATWRTLYQAVSLLKIAGRRFRSLTVKEWPLVPDLLTAASATLESGEPG